MQKAKEIISPQKFAIVGIFHGTINKAIKHLSEHKINHVIAISLDNKIARDNEFCDQVTQIVEAGTAQILADIDAAAEAYDAGKPVDA